MNEVWPVLLSETSGAPRRPRRRRLGLVAAAIVLAGAVVAVALVLARGGRSAGEEAPRPEAAAAPATDAPDRPPAPKLKLYAKETRLAGVELLERGELDAAEKWLTGYLEAPSDGRDDQALYALALLHRLRGRDEAAEDTLRRLVAQRPDSLRAGDAWRELGSILAASGRREEARQCLLEAVRVYPRSSGGMLAARELADDLYDRHVTKKTQRSEWERIRDLYSVALPGLRDSPSERAEVVRRLDELNRWIIFTPHARPSPGYPSNIVFHTVKPRETLGAIARRYGVTEGAIRRLNGISPETHIIRPDEELKILRGRCEIFVDSTALRMTVWINGSYFKEYPVGLGREERTPIGKFRIASRVVDPDWTPPGRERIPFGDPRNILGTRWLGFAPSGAGRGIGIHGSVLKDGVWQGVGERASEGCIRMANPDVEELFDFAVEGTEVTVSE